MLTIKLYHYKIETMENEYGKWWVKGDINAFFGLFVNIVTNTMVLSALLLYVIHVPANVVFKMVVPAVGLSIAIGNIYYAYMARRLAKKEKRFDVAAVPYGTAVDGYFICTFLVMAPVYWKTGDSMLALRVGIAWAIIEGIIEVTGAFYGEKLRKITPQAAMLGSISGLGIGIIAMNSGMQSWELPYIALLSIAIFIVGWIGNKKMPLKLPAGLFIVVIGVILGWATGYMKLDVLVGAIKGFELAPPLPHPGNIPAGFIAILPYIATALPMGLANVVGAMDNVESAAAAGDEYNLKEVLVVDGVGTLIGALFGNPFPTCVYIGHPGWKAIGGRIGYSLATGIATMVLCVLGLVPIVMAIIPMPAVLPILVYIGLVIGAQAFQVVPKKHMPAIVFAIIPWIANWGITIVNNALNSAGVSAETEGVLSAMNSNGLYYQGLAVLGSGPVISSMIFAALVVFIVDSEYKKATGCAVLAALLSFFGFMHADAVGLGMATGPAIGYVLMAVAFVIVGLYNRNEKIENSNN